MIEAGETVKVAGGAVSIVENVHQIQEVRTVETALQGSQLHCYRSSRRTSY